MKFPNSKFDIPCGFTNKLLHITLNLSETSGSTLDYVILDAARPSCARPRRAPCTDGAGLLRKEGVVSLFKMATTIESAAAAVGNKKKHLGIPEAVFVVGE